MRLGIKGKQVLGVTAIVGAVVVVLSLLNVARLARVSLEESRARAELLTNAIYQRAQQVVGGGADPLAALGTDPGLRSILESSLYSKNVMYAALVDARGVAVAHADRTLEGQPLPRAGDLGALLERSAVSQLQAMYTSRGQNLEFRAPLLMGDAEIGSIRVGVSTLLIRHDLDQSLGPALLTALAALALSVVVATLLSQRLLRPIHVISSGLTRLGRGEFGVQLDLASQDEFGELGTSFNAVSDHLLAEHAQAAGTAADSESAEYERQLQATLRYARKLAALGRLSAGVAHEVKNPLNAMMIHLELLRQQVAPIGARGPAHSAGSGPAPSTGSGQAGSGRPGAAALATDPPPVDRDAALQHVDVIAREIRRLDEVVQGFLKFARPEELKLQALSLRSLVDEIVPIVRPEAERARVQLTVDCAGAPDVSGDSAMLRQAFLNLALNAIQAMPDGGTLRIRCEAARSRRAAITFSDTGVGIAPEHLRRIFDLYFTTREAGSGIGLSMVYRTIQMHDGEIEVESTPGAGTTFRVLLPRA